MIWTGRADDVIFITFARPCDREAFISQCMNEVNRDKFRAVDYDLTSPETAALLAETTPAGV